MPAVRQIQARIARPVWERGWLDVSYRLALGVVLFLGVAVRLVGHIGDPIGLWLDEALWAKRLVTEPLWTLTIRPIGYMWATRQLVNVLGPSEFWLRFIPNVASVASLLLAPYVASRLFSWRFARLLLVFLWAAHPALIDFAKEFSPYAFEVLVHMVPIVLYLRYRQTKRLRHLAALLVLLPILLPFAYNIAFAYPGVLLVILWRGWTLPHRGLMVGALLSGLASAGMVIAGYALVFHKTQTESTTEYWGDKYDVFYVETPKARDHDTRVEWISEKYGDVAALPGLRRTLWELPAPLEGEREELQQLERLSWIALHLMGAFYLVTRRRGEEALLLFGPLVVIVVANLFGVWPFGAFRTNLFLCAYTLPIAVFGIELMGAATSSRRVAIASLASLAYVVPALVFGFDGRAPKATWTRNLEIPVVLEVLRTQRQRHLDQNPRAPRELVVMDLHTAEPYDYYLRFHPAARERHGEYFRRNFRRTVVSGGSGRLTQGLLNLLQSEGDPVWVVVSKPAYVGAVQQVARRRGSILFEERISDDHLLLWVAPR